MKITYKSLNRINIIVFIAIILVPLIFINTESGKIAEGENRYLASFPEIKKSDGSYIKKFITQFEEWFNDNIGFRSQLIKMYSIINYEMFNVSPKSDTLLGEEDWLYYYNDAVLKDYQNINLPTNEQLKFYSDNIEFLNSYCQNRGINFINFMLFDKKTIYPEFYPKTIKKIGNLSRYDIINSYLISNTDVHVVSPLQELLEAKKNEQVYSKNYDNAHWNIYGAFIGYQVLMKNIQAYFPDIKSLKIYDFDVKKYERTSKLNGAITFSEEAYSFIPKYESSIDEDVDYWLGDTLLENQHYRYINKDKSLPKILIIGDSYMYMELLPILAESFSELTFIHNHDVEFVKKYIEELSPDIVVYESVERMFEATQNELYKLRIDGDNGINNQMNYQQLPSLGRNNLQYEDISGNIVVYTGAHIDKCNGELMSNVDTIKVKKNKERLIINGWGADFTSKQPASDIYIQAGDKIFKADYGQDRADVAASLGNINYTKTGFMCEIDTSYIIDNNITEIGIIVISSDGSYKYEPVIYNIEVE